MSSIYYINLNQDGGAGGDMYDNSKKIKAFKEKAKERSCINELDYFINHKEECKNQPINYDTRNHLVLGEPQKMIKQDGREWIVYNATIQNNAKNEDSFQTITEEQVDTSELFNEGQIGGKYKKIKISSIKKKIFQDNEDIYLVDPSIRTIPKKHNHIQALVAAAAERCSKCGLSLDNYTADKEYCNQCINTSHYVDLDGKKAYNLQLKNLQFQRQYKLEREQRERMQMEQEDKSI